MAGYAGGPNTLIPTLDLSGNLQIEFSRNVENFALNRYVTITPVKNPWGDYLYFNPLDLARLRNKPHGAKWAPGTLRPAGFDNRYGFEARQFRAERYSFDTALDTLSVDVANWNIQKNHSGMLAQEAMTHRSYQVCNLITNAAQYAASHVATATALGGGFLDGGTTADPRIMKAFQSAALIIQKDTMGRIKQGEISAVMNAETASKLARSRELREYIMQSPDARDQITGKNRGYNSRYGLPNTLYTFDVVVEDAFYNDDNRGAASEVGTPVFPDNTILLLVRKGDLESTEGSASYSTVHLFMYEDMTVESKTDEWNRQLLLSVVDHFDTKVVAPVTGFLITNIFS